MYPLSKLLGFSLESVFELKCYTLVLVKARKHLICLHDLSDRMLKTVYNAIQLIMLREGQYFGTFISCFHIRFLS